MKRICIFLLLLFLLLGYGAGAQFITAAIPDSIGSHPLAVSERYTVNLVFPFMIFHADLGSGDLIGKKLGRAENILLLKANRVNFPETNVSVYLADGSLYSFRVSYSDTLPVFNYSYRKNGMTGPLGTEGDSSLIIFSGPGLNARSMEADASLVKKDRGFLWVAASEGKVRLRLKSLYIKDQLLWLSFMASNYSLIDFQPALLRFSLEDRKRVRRTAVQSIELDPVYRPASDLLAGKSRNSWSVGFAPFTISRGKNLVVEWSESGGGRRIRLLIRGNKLLKARIYK